MGTRWSFKQETDSQKEMISSSEQSRWPMKNLLRSASETPLSRLTQLTSAIRRTLANSVMVIPMSPVADNLYEGYKLGFDDTSTIRRESRSSTPPASLSYKVAKRCFRFHAPPEITWEQAARSAQELPDQKRTKAISDLACIAHKSLEICERCRLKQQNSPARPENSAAT
jgi:hypothetical protein